MEHGWFVEPKTWGDLVDLLGISSADTPREAPVKKLIGVPKVLRRKFLDGQEGDDESQGGGFTALHPIGCPCCPPPTDPGIRAFQRKLLKSLAKNGTE